MKADPYSLDRLQDIIRLEPVSWWPPAPFWLWLISLLAVWALYALLLAVFRWVTSAYRRQALREVEQIERTYDGNNARTLTIQLARLLKRVALVSYPREKVASLSGDDWLRFLNDTCDQADFLQDPSAFLGAVSYRASSVPVTETEFRLMLFDVRTWIETHQAELAQ